MPYKHAGEYGDVLKHLPLCEILSIEKPLRYHETNSSCSGHTISRNPNTEYGVFGFMHKLGDTWTGFEYFRLLRANGIDNMRYTGSPGLAMGVLGERTKYFFHDIEAEAIEDVTQYALSKDLKANLHTFCGDSRKTFLSEDYLLYESDFLLIDPYELFEKNDVGEKFFDVFEKSLISGSKTLLWYGFGHLTGKKQIADYLRYLSEKHTMHIWSFDLWLKCMTEERCVICPGVPGCGLACANLSDKSVGVLTETLQLISGYYTNAEYCGHHATLVCETTKY